MKHLYTLIILATATLTTLTACRETSDELLDTKGTSAAELEAETYTEIWDVLWNGYNQNYVGWAEETVNWDERNTTYRPQFAKLDKEVQAIGTADSADARKAIAAQADSLFGKAFEGLHDGHSYYEYVDYATSERHTKRLYNGYRDREDINDDPAVYDAQHFSYYVTSTNDIVSDSIRYLSAGSIVCNKLVKDILPTLQAEQHDITQGTADPNIYTEAYKQELNTLVESILGMKTAMADNLYRADKLFKTYKEELKAGKYDLIIALHELPNPTGDYDSWGTIQMFTTKDNIAYYYLSDFYIPGERLFHEMFNTKENATDRLIEETYSEAITAWHDNVYRMHRNGQLRGVILDVRNNTGGYTHDLAKFAGALYKGDRYCVAMKKMKNGTGRLDYTVPTPVYTDCWGNNPDDITEPIAILTNAFSASCSELSTASVKQHANGVSIGMCTIGAGNMLMLDPSTNSSTGYAGCIGTRGVTPVFAYIPFVLTTYNGSIGVIEGRGIEPDIEVRFDQDEYDTTGRDNQFERALTYIRQGK